VQVKALAVLLLWLFLASALLLLWNLPANTVKVLVQVRIPELVLSVAYGGILGVGGCVYQSVVKNPLADPHILGVSAGGALGAVLATAVGLNPEGFALAGGLLATWLVYMVAKLLKNSLKLHCCLPIRSLPVLPLPPLLIKQNSSKKKHILKRLI